MTPHVVHLPWSAPPLTMNGREHWRVKAKVTAMIRNAACFVVTHNDLPKGLERITVEMVYRPRDNRRRDADNLVSTFKACCDGIVDAGVVPDDTPDLMVKLMPRIVPAAKGQPGALWLEISEAGDVAA